METETAVDPLEEFKNSLRELTSNNKYTIDGLTMVAEENQEFAAQVAILIEHQLKTRPNSEKLYLLYLIDAICKALPGSPYPSLFTQNLVSNFCNVFSASNEAARKSLHRLRKSWDECKIFPQQKLNAIDEKVHKIDPKWPVQVKSNQASSKTDQTTPATNNQPQKQASQSSNLTAGSQAVTNAGVDVVAGPKRPLNNAQVNGRRKRLKAGRTRNNQSNEMVTQQPQAPLPQIVPAPQPFFDPNIIQAPAPVLPLAFMNPSMTIPSNDQMHQVMPTAPYIDSCNLIIAPNDLQPPPPASASQMQPQIVYQSYNQIQPESHDPHLSVLDSLYGGEQCSSCSLRFDDKSRYAVHLDWHYRQNEKKKSDNMFARRKWYYPLKLWVQFREINDEDLDLDSSKNVEASSLSNCDKDEPTAPAFQDDRKNICSVCQERFEKFYDEEEEEWRLRNAKLYNEDQVYHPICIITNQ